MESKSLSPPRYCFSASKIVSNSSLMLANIFVSPSAKNLA
jgi:hypothetical protein